MNELSKEGLRYSFCKFKDGEKTSLDFLNDVKAVFEFLSLQNYDRIAPIVTSDYYFAVITYACISIKKKLIILPNKSKETIDTQVKIGSKIINDADVMSIIELRTQNEDISFTLDDDAQIIFHTSGSRGAPKEICKTYKNIMCEVNELHKTFSAYFGNKVFVSTASPYHIYGFLFRLMLPICFKYYWYSEILEFPEEILKLKNQYKEIILVSTPAFLKRSLFDKSQKLNENQDIVFSSGGELKYDEANFVLENIGVLPIEIYGSTESGGIAYRRQINLETLWTPFDSVRVSTIDSYDYGLRLKIQSPYFDQDELFMEDKIEMIGQKFKLLGRVDDVVKIEEKRVSLSEINNKLSKHSFVKECASLSLIKGNRQIIGCAIVLNDQGYEVLRKNDNFYIYSEFRKYLAESFDKVILPRQFVFLEELPFNSQSKLIKSELEKYFE